jgi:hypothetical protein
MRKTLAALLFALTAALSSAALAMAPKKAANPKAASPKTAVGDDDPKLTAKDDCALQRARDPKAACELNFEGDEIEGPVFGPGGELMMGWVPANFPPLIRFRGEFVYEIVKSARR